MLFLRGALLAALSGIVLMACHPQSAAPKGAERQLGPGGELPGLTGEERSRFVRGRFWFEWFFVPDEGLGPVFNDVSCIACHGAPASGGGHHTVTELRFHTPTTVPYPAGSLDQAEGAPQLSIRSVGREFPSPGCDIEPETVPDSAIAVTVRATPALFGAGLIEAIPDQTLIENGQAAARANPEISGVAALSAGESSGLLQGVRATDQLPPALPRPEPAGAVARFGARGLTATVLEFAHLAFVNELGITTPHPKFGVDPRPMGIPASPTCDQPVDPEMDLAEVQRTADFVRFLAPPPRGSITQETTAGEVLFDEIGCASCHTPLLMTGDSPVAALAHQPVGLFSDLLLHDMGPELADGVIEGSGTESEWRTPPLWGLGLQAKPLMHDGRAGFDVAKAILLHGGEGAGARDRFFGLEPERQELVLRFLLSL